MKHWQKVSLRLLTQDETRTLVEQGVQTYDYTKLTAINTCPRWGIIRYTQHKTMPGGGRSMALEAGTVMHECFAAIRLIQLWKWQRKGMLADYHGRRIFGEDRWRDMCRDLSEDNSIAARNIALNCLASANFVDDPYDKRRTYNNMETSLLYYIQRWEWERYPVWIKDADDPYSDVGIEVPFAVLVEAYGLVPPDGGDGIAARFIYTGRVDGLHVDRSGEVIIQENKTASRMDEAWRMSFDMSHQVTGYCMAASLFAGTPVSRGLVIGLTIPLPRNLMDGLDYVPVSRPQHQKEQWFDWLEHTVTLHDTHVADPLSAPALTHSCNRYFRPCAYIPLCASDRDEQEHILREMVVEEWSPLAEKAGD